MTLLDELLQADGNRVVTFDGQRAWTLAQLRQSAGLLARQLTALPVQRWAICTGDSYHFCQALLACAMAERAVVLPGHQRLAGLQELLAQDAFDGLLCDEPLPLPCTVLRIDAVTACEPLPAIASHGSDSDAGPRDHPLHLGFNRSAQGDHQTLGAA